MISHDQLDGTTPRADSIRFKCLGEGLSRHVFKVLFIILNQKGCYEEGDYKGSRVYKVPLLSKKRFLQILFFSILLLPALFKANRQGKFDIIFVNSILSVPGALIFRWLAGPCLIQLDVMVLLSEERFLGRPKTFVVNMVKGILRLIEGFLMSRVDFITTINEQHRKRLLRIRRPIFVIRDGIPEGILKPSREGRKDREKIVVIFVGQLNHFRLDLLFKIWPTLVKEHPDLELKICGSGPQFDHYLQMVNSLGLEKSVSFEGVIEHEKIFGFIEKADIAYSDDWSKIGFPMKLFEYMAMGIPMVVEGTEGVRELLTDEVDALLYENEEELKEKISILARDASLRKRIGEKGREAVRQFTWEKSLEALTSIYSQYFRRDEGS